MDDVVIDILRALRERGPISAVDLDKLIRKHCKRTHDSRRTIAKKRILPYYLEVKANDPKRFASWGVSSELDELFVQTLKMKPRRTASGVATITVIAKPWPCSSNCIYCPCDIRMPKSYLHDEPACQRAERNFFDPYLQVASRLAALQRMGHTTDKVELIVLGGTWTDYPAAYRLWYARELFRALNDDDVTRERTVGAIRSRYAAEGLTSDAEALAARCAATQARVNAGEIGFGEAFSQLYSSDSSWQRTSRWQVATQDDVYAQHALNETCAHRVVGLVVETRPDCLTVEHLTSLRKLGCTKIQMGIQSLDDEVLAANGRAATSDSAAAALELCRLFGFKTHVHFMLNLLSSTPERDKADYLRLVTDRRFKPDEIKLYPCALVEGTKLVEAHDRGLWRPYTEEELVEVLCADMLATPSYMRVSRMIRDISAADILVGNKKTNLRQIVDNALAPRASEVREIRFREIGTRSAELESMSLDDVRYETAATVEHFLQWIDPQGRILAFLRLSLPRPEAFERHDWLPVHPGEAMIREVHVYGFAAKLSAGGAEKTSEAAQHHGLGKALIARACEIARKAGFERINVISSVGTRAYYRKLGFEDGALYQTRETTGTEAIVPLYETT